MSNINKRALREEAEKATGAHDRLSILPADDIFDISQHEGTQLDADITAMNAFSESANPSTVLALLDELEAAEKRIAELERERVAMESVTLAMRDDMRTAAAGKGEAS
ncbi:TPA: ead/Ea22-like family protein [Salmonella enterica]|nr:ead/Ea22-like family protein [Salmonella enterica]HAK4054243.1 ead/Ea22-like family protein [Salmonella enterica]